MADPTVEFKEDHENVQEILNLIERLPSTFESSNVNRIIKELNGN